MFIITKLFGTLKSQIRDLFGFSRAETNGVLVLLILLWVLLTLPPIIRWYELTYGKPIHESDRAVLDSTLTLMQKACTSVETVTQAATPPIIPSQAKRPATARKLPKPFDINLAEPDALQDLPGIGPIFSARIVKYRNKLGGFVRKEQYQEIYGLDTVALHSMLQYTYIASSFEPNKININQADFKTLVAHPYLSYEQVKQIVQLRKRKQRFSHIEQLLVSHALDTATFEKVQPYITTAE